jgi:hypothetical protein
MEVKSKSRPGFDPAIDTATPSLSSTTVMRSPSTCDIWR